jgi:hypothetical protein
MPRRTRIQQVMSPTADAAPIDDNTLSLNEDEVSAEQDLNPEKLLLPSDVSRLKIFPLKDARSYRKWRSILVSWFGSMNVNIETQHVETVHSIWVERYCMSILLNAIADNTFFLVGNSKTCFELLHRLDDTFKSLSLIQVRSLRSKCRNIMIRNLNWDLERYLVEKSEVHLSLRECEQGRTNEEDILSLIDGLEGDRRFLSIVAYFELNKSVSVEELVLALRNEASIRIPTLLKRTKFIAKRKIDEVYVTRKKANSQRNLATIVIFVEEVATLLSIVTITQALLSSKDKTRI